MYEGPVELYTNIHNIHKMVQEEQENAIMYKIEQEMAIKIDREELVKA